VTGRKPVPRIGRKEKVLVTAVEEEVVAHNSLSSTSASRTECQITIFYRIWSVS
jgi:hypothetical protein